MTTKTHSHSHSHSHSLQLKLSDLYPVNSILELTLTPSDEAVSGLVYCTDERSNSIVLKKRLNYTTLASEVRIINANCIKKKKVIKAQAPLHKDMAGTGNGNNNDGTEGQGGVEMELALPLSNHVTKKSIEEREKRAIMLAEESFRHINQKASPEGQIVFDRLLKACNEVKWSGESILVLNQIRVDPPYHSDNCHLLPTGGSGSGSGSNSALLSEGSLERVKRIVGA